MASYYDGLSSDSSSDDSSRGSDIETARHSDTTIPDVNTAVGGGSNARFILHMDVDCFYCQCESLDRNIPLDRPLAIGQKQIVVTSNYAARTFGVCKLQMRDEAQQLCSHLMIVEGSDLERYRIHSRRLYQTLRRVCQELHPQVAVCKGSMDEAMVDLTAAVVAMERSRYRQKPQNLHSIYIYGANNEPVNEGNQNASLSEASPKTDVLLCAASLAVQVRDTILRETGFTTTLGVSTNPMLSKLASGLRKPGTVNVLYPWKSDSLLRATSLRSIPGIGSRTVAALLPCLRDAFPGRPDDCKWTCGDLVKLTVQHVEDALNAVPAFSKSSSELSRTILGKCRGMDDSQVVDDGGRPPLTVSVENSFRRGSVLTIDAIKAGMQELYRRLPRLLQDRWSLVSDYPKTIRLTVRYVDRESSVLMHHRRPFVTKSKQVAIQGKRLYTAPTVESQDALLHSMVSPLLHSLLSSIKLDVTRINIALVDFQALESSPEKELGPPSAWRVTPIAHQRGLQQVRLPGPGPYSSPSDPSKRPRPTSEGSIDDDCFDDTIVNPQVYAERKAEIGGKESRSIQTLKKPKRSRIEHFFAYRARKTER